MNLIRLVSFPVSEVISFSGMCEKACGKLSRNQRSRLDLCVVPQALDWNLCPETPISWLKLYAQVEARKDGENFLEPQFPQETYIQITQVPLTAVPHLFTLVHRIL